MSCVKKQSQIDRRMGTKERHRCDVTFLIMASIKIFFARHLFAGLQTGKKFSFLAKKMSGGNMEYPIQQNHLHSARYCLNQ
jgi:hypothetical protein